MPDAKLSALAALTALTGNEIFYVVEDADTASPLSRRISFADLAAAITAGATTTLDSLTDVETPAPNEGDTLGYQSGNWVNMPPPTGGASALDDLTDVDLSVGGPLETFQALIWGSEDDSGVPGGTWFAYDLLSQVEVKNNLSELEDTLIGPDPPADSFLYWNSGLWVPNTIQLSILTDVNITPAYHGEVLTFDNATNQWVNKGGSEVVADTSTAFAPLVNLHANTMVTLSNAAPITVTLPSNALSNFRIGAEIDFLWLGVGQPTFAAGAGATVNATPGLKLRARYSACTAKKISTDGWVLIGDLSA